MPTTHLQHAHDVGQDLVLQCWHARLLHLGHELADRRVDVLPGVWQHQLQQRPQLRQALVWALRWV
jgi:hypothetical protein